MLSFLADLPVIHPIHPARKPDGWIRHRQLRFRENHPGIPNVPHKQNLPHTTFVLPYYSWKFLRNPLRAFKLNELPVVMYLSPIVFFQP